ncbi:hypothetical protein [Desulfobacter curvatus]|uniref:hypothetical protein n=1 Tax=Desulfobacter curvatus TaxID=2290 RepID=UPI0003612A6B|nr:hypothetical protein [Desulfobacter curvatus]
MRKYILKFKIEDWAEKWGKIGWDNGIHDYHYLHGKGKKREEEGHFVQPLDKKFRASLAYFH